MTVSSSKALVTIGSFIAAVPLGSLLAGLVLVAYRGLLGDTDIMWPVLGLGGTFTIFGALPAILVGIPALALCRKMKLTSPLAALVMTAGGAAAGALLVMITFVGLEDFGAAAGGSIGFMLGVIVYPRTSTAAQRG